MTNEPTELDQHELQTRIDMREEAEATQRFAHQKSDAYKHAVYVLKLLDEIESLETTIATQACDIAEYQRKAK